MIRAHARGACTQKRKLGPDLEATQSCAAFYFHFIMRSCPPVRACLPACHVPKNTVEQLRSRSRRRRCRERGILRNRADVVYAAEMMRVAPKFYPIQSSERAVTRIGNIGRLAQDTCTSSLALENPIFPRRFSIIHIASEFQRGFTTQIQGGETVERTHVFDSMGVALAWQARGGGHNRKNKTYSMIVTSRRDAQRKKPRNTEEDRSVLGIQRAARRK